MIHAKYLFLVPRRSFVYLGFIAVVFLSSCSARKKTVKLRPANPAGSSGVAPAISNSQASDNNKAIQKEKKDAIAAYVPYTSLTYIDRFKTIAIQEMNLYGIPASITLAQGLFESGSGNSELAKIANNHFGIKCTSDWKGKGYYKDDDQHNDCFRVYDRAEDSFRDHSNFLKRKNYAFLFTLDKDDYKGWAYGLKKAGYATNPNYPQLLINIIEKYSLYQFDQPEGQVQKEQREDKVLTQIQENPATAPKDSVMQS